MAMAAVISPIDQIRRSIRRHMFFGLFVVIGLFVVAGRWATVTIISGAVVAPGQIVVEGNVKKVQHASGGTVGKLFVKDGDHVNAQDILIKLEDTSTKANLSIAKKNENELLIRKARLIAEVEGAKSFDVPPALLEYANSPEIQSILTEETGVMNSKLSGIESQKAQLSQRVAQLNEEIKGLNKQLEAKTSEMSIASNELAAMVKLLQQSLAPQQRVDDMRKDYARLEGEQGSLIANIAQTNGKISETNLQILQIDRDHLTEVSKELRDTESKLSEAVQRRIETEDLLGKSEIRAPQQGVIYELSVHSPGSVISAGEPIMFIVPDDETLAVEAKIAPNDIDQVTVGQGADLRFTAFNQRTTPIVGGEIEFISPDLVTDQRTGANYYTARIKIKPSSEPMKLLPGMPAEAFIKTTDRSVISYILKPLSDQLARSFKER